VAIFHDSKQAPHNILQYVITTRPTKFNPTQNSIKKFTLDKGNVQFKQYYSRPWFMIELDR